MADKDSCTPQSRRNQAQELAEVLADLENIDPRPYREGGHAIVNSKAFTCLGENERQSIMAAVLEKISLPASDKLKAAEEVIHGLPNMAAKPDGNQKHPLREGERSV